MPFDSKLRIMGAFLAISAVLLAIGAGYERGGLAGLRDLTTDVLHFAGLASKPPARAAAPAPTPARKAPSATLAPDEAFWLRIKDSRAAGLFEAFLKRFPDSSHSQEARAKLQALQQAPRAAAGSSRVPMQQHGHGMMMGHGGD